jgi:hypothetical protein
MDTCHIGEETPHKSLFSRINDPNKYTISNGVN